MKNLTEVGYLGRLTSRIFALEWDATDTTCEGISHRGVTPCHYRYGRIRKHPAYPKHKPHIRNACQFLTCPRLAFHPPALFLQTLPQHLSVSLCNVKSAQHRQSAQHRHFLPIHDNGHMTDASARAETAATAAPDSQTKTDDAHDSGGEKTVRPYSKTAAAAAAAAGSHTQAGGAHSAGGVHYRGGDVVAACTSPG